MPPLKLPARISGPASVHTFDVPARMLGAAGVRVILFGDEHFKFDNLCAPCNASNDCADIVTFLTAAVETVRSSAGDTLDVFMELARSYQARKKVRRVYPPGFGEGGPLRGR